MDSAIKADEMPAVGKCAKEVDETIWRGLSQELTEIVEHKDVTNKVSENFLDELSKLLKEATPATPSTQAPSSAPHTPQGSASSPATPQCAQFEQVRAQVEAAEIDVHMHPHLEKTSENGHRFELRGPMGNNWYKHLQDVEGLREVCMSPQTIWRW